MDKQFYINQLINKMKEHELIVEKKVENSITGVEYVMGESFQRSIITKMNQINSIANYCLEIDGEGVKKGNVPVLTGESIIIETHKTGVIKPLNLEGLRFDKSEFELNEILTYCPVNSTIIDMSKGAFVEVMSLYLAKCLIKTLNSIAIKKLNAKKESKKVVYNANDFTKDVLKYCLVNSDSVIFIDKDNKSSLLLGLDTNKEPQYLGVKIEVVEGIGNNVILLGGKTALAYIKNKNDMKIGVDHDFLNNIGILTLTHNADFAPLDVNAYQVYEFTV